ncbi:uncharacterized protein DUF1223 [Flavobacterium sp. 90]|uniref:DUF1223 domain-containing protein n=1 Tax=unclassified Flavobacterium TaxID=196869 RepID=UPI000EAF27F2|nr:MULTISPECIES: DUF1223 domain-containing protein [unclassified Flavobacterium]RKR04933.1 uncharacterized protein DUF1223 [Flavobacterium sp. 81]TCK56253.1 uncharacterized protein DUF1223 [Flavobacterium sp. 90]
MKNALLIVAVIALSVLFFLNCYMFPDSHEELIGKPKSEKTNLEISNNNGFAIVELFTSEGCSSCPPADELITKLQKETSSKNIYLLAYHVDYWDRLGWKDQFSSNEFTIRQQKYQDWLHLFVMYTPQFIINGTTEFAGYNEAALDKKVSDALKIKTLFDLKLNAKSNKDSLEVDFKTNMLEKNTSLFVATIQKQGISNVIRGENKGNILHHTQIVRRLNSFSLTQKDGKVKILKPENYNLNDFQIIGFIQNTVTGKILITTKADLQ